MPTDPPALPDRPIRQVVHGDHAIVVGAGNVTIHNFRAPGESPDHRPLEILLDRVEQFWIKGVLETSVYSEALLELGKEALPEVVEHPWEKVLEVPGQASRTLPAERGIGEVFAEVGRFLLVLGEPGSGKTTTLLELARGLIASAREDERNPIPVVFNLSTWAMGKKSLADWLVDELKSKYFVSRPLAETWLAQNRLLPLLDGLDEVESASQGACVEAVNAFVQDYGPQGLAVCSRRAEYLCLSVRLKLNGAVRLLPLTAEQIATYFGKAGPRLAALDAALQRDPGLLELARLPLMLGVMTLAYKDLPAVVLTDRDLSAADVFSTYIDRMFDRKGKGKQPYSKEATVAWLSRLARKLRRESQTIFLVEQLQPTWLTTSIERWSYALASRLLVGVTALVLVLVAIGRPSVQGILFGGALGILAGVIDGERLSRWNRRKPSSRWWWHGYHLVGSFGLIALLLAMRSGMPFFSEVHAYSVFLSALPVLIWGHLLGTRARREMGQDIQPVETLRWTWKSAWKSGLVGFLAGFFVWPGGWSLASELQGSSGSYLNFGILLGGAIYVGIVGAMLGALFGGFDYGFRESKTRSNQGIALSGRNGAWVGAFVGLGVMVLLGAPFLWTLVRAGARPSEFLSILSPILSFGCLGGLSAAFWFGWIDVLEHFVLRLILWRSGDAPLDYPRFLDHAAKLIFLQKVGGGYIFVHRLLLEHFAALPR